MAKKQLPHACLQPQFGDKCRYSSRVSRCLFSSTPGSHHLHIHGKFTLLDQPQTIRATTGTEFTMWGAWLERRSCLVVTIRRQNQCVRHISCISSIGTPFIMMTHLKFHLCISSHPFVRLTHLISHPIFHLIATPSITSDTSCFSSNIYISSHFSFSLL